jgi:hypothetical protein
MSTEQPRSAQQRKDDTVARLEKDNDAWVATADLDGNAYLVPLSFHWDGSTLLMATPETSPTGRNLTAAGRVRLGLGPTRDVVMIEGTVETYSRETVPAELADAFAAEHWDARIGKTVYAFYRITPQVIQAWREENELKGRTLMRDGAWLV